ncbi:hypothetical protein FB451DRAFT_941688, partial [Mycena latifolia]
LMVVLLDDDEEFSFDCTQVLNPPNIHFSHDIPRLFGEWKSSTLLMVNGRGIAIKHWPLFYRCRKQGRTQKNGAWDEIRRTVPGRRASKIPKFWAKYSGADKIRLRYQQILNVLKDACESQEKSDADDARRFF